MKFIEVETVTKEYSGHTVCESTWWGTQREKYVSDPVQLKTTGKLLFQLLDTASLALEEFDGLVYGRLCLEVPEGLKHQLISKSSYDQLREILLKDTVG